MKFRTRYTYFDQKKKCSRLQGHASRRSYHGEAEIRLPLRTDGGRSPEETVQAQRHYRRRRSGLNFCKRMIFAELAKEYEEDELILIGAEVGSNP